MPSNKFWGHPPTTKRSVPNSSTRTVRYENGLYPGAMASRETATMGLDGQKPGIDTPVEGHGEQANRHATSKAEENERYENAHPDLPRGTLSR